MLMELSNIYLLLEYCPRRLLTLPFSGVMANSARVGDLKSRVTATSRILPALVQRPAQTWMVYARESREWKT